MSSTTASVASTATSTSSQPTQYRSVGIILAVGSGVLIGTSFVFKKRGLLRSQAGHAAGEGVAYLKSPLWWTGMIMMICGELCNFGAYAFVEAIVVTPLGALSVVISAILSHFILKEKLTLFGWIGCTQCILGAIIIALNAPDEQSVSSIAAFKKLFLAPWFLAYGGCCIAAALLIIFWVAPRYGKKTMMWYIAVCSLIGGISVSCTQGLGACILTSIRGENQFKNWFIYFLLVFVACTLLTEIYYLNVALALFNTAMVTPTYYVLFTFCTLVTSVILYQGLKASAEQILTIALGFLVICSGIFILQMSKVDPRHLSRIDRRTTLLLQAAREEVNPPGTEDGEEVSEKKLLEATEEPGVDAIAGRFGAFGGTVVRARRRATIHSAKGQARRRARSGTNASGPLVMSPANGNMSTTSIGIDSVRAHELQEQWKAEKRTGEAAPVTHIFPSDEAGAKSNSIEGLPFTASRSSPTSSSPNRPVNSGVVAPTFLSSDAIAASPQTISASELRQTPSVHFSDQPSPSARPPSVRNDYFAQGGGPHPGQIHGGTLMMPVAPPPALVPTSDTFLPSLNLPTPSFSILSRNQSGNSQISPIAEDSPVQDGTR